MAEMVMVVAIIMILAAAAMPQIVNYTRMYRVRQAASQISSQIQTARAKAVMKNVNLGVVWVARENSSAWVIEDDLQPQTAPNWSLRADEKFADMLKDPVQSSGWMPLPGEVVFDAPNKCPGGPAAGAWGLRFGSIGNACGIVNGLATCPQPGTATFTNLISLPGADTSSSAGFSVCLYDKISNLRRRVTITLSGRIHIQ